MSRLRQSETIDSKFLRSAILNSDPCFPPISLERVFLQLSDSVGWALELRYNAIKYNKAAL